MLTECRSQATLSPIQSYLKEISQTPLLTPEQEQQLGRRCQQGCQQARNQLVQANLRLVVYFARRYSGLDLLDLIQQGSLGLLRAAEKFDPEKGVKFSTYAAHWIKQSIRRALRYQGKTIRVPVETQTLVASWQRVALELEETLQQKPSDKEIADKLGLTPRQILRIKKAINSRCQSTQVQGEETTLDLQLADPKAIDPLDKAEEKDNQHQALETIRAGLCLLNAREQLIIKRRFGLDGCLPQQLWKIALDLGIDRERVRQLEKGALEKLSAKLAC